MQKFTSLLRRLATWLGLLDEYAPCLICGEYVCVDESICDQCYMSVAGEPYNAKCLVCNKVYVTSDIDPADWCSNQCMQKLY